MKHIQHKVLQSDQSGTDDKAEVLTDLLNALPSLEGNAENKCQDQIKALLQTKLSSVITTFCNWLCRQDSLSPFIEDCILLSIGNMEHPEEDIKHIDFAICFKLVSIELFENIARIVSETYQPDLMLLMENCLHRLRKKDVAFAKIVLFFVMHHKGKYRIVGRKMWDEYRMESSKFDPLSLAEDDQIVFGVFMLQDFGNPEQRLPKILPLLLSTSEKVRQALLMHMIPYVDNYMGHVTEAIDKLGIDTSESRQLKQYVESRADFIQKRRGLKELSPEYSQYKYFQEACRVEKEARAKFIKKYEKKNTPLWMNMCKKEVLARGGGWRLENGRTHHLSPIEVSFPSMLMLQSMTPLEQDKWVNELLKDWDVAEGNH